MIHALRRLQRLWITRPSFAVSRPPAAQANDISPYMDLLQTDSQIKTIVLPQYIELRELAELLHVKPFRVVADVLTLKQFKRAEDLIDFATAATVAQKHGYVATKAS